MSIDTAVRPDTRQEDSEGADNLSSIAKAARVLRALALAGSGDARVTDLAALAALPKSTTHRVLAELISQGLVSHTGQRYRLGTAWFTLQSALCSSEWLQLAEQARRPLGSLFERTGATVHFAVLDGTQVLYLEKLTGRGGTAVLTRVGAHMPPTCTAVGKALLAHADPDVVRSTLSQPLPRRCHRSIVLPNLLMDQLNQVRRTGLAYDMEETQPGVCCVAAPVFRNGKAVAAVSVTRVGGGLTAAHDTEVRRAAVGIGDRLEWASFDDVTRAAPARPAPAGM